MTLEKKINIGVLIFGIIIFVMVIASTGGISENTRMLGVAWLSIVSGAFGILGGSRKWADTASIVFYALNILYNAVHIPENKSHIVVIMGVAVCLGVLLKIRDKKGED